MYMYTHTYNYKTNLNRNVMLSQNKINHRFNKIYVWYKQWKFNRINIEIIINIKYYSLQIKILF